MSPTWKRVLVADIEGVKPGCAGRPRYNWNTWETLDAEFAFGTFDGTGGQEKATEKGG
jgi:hypothetical protein